MMAWILRTRRCKVESIERETKFLKERLPYQEVYNRLENLRFMERELNIEGAHHIEFQWVHRIQAKKPGNSRPIIARF